MSQIKQGYKQTKVGVIPEDWEVVHVKDIFQFIKTYSFPRSKLTDTGNTEYLHYGDIHKKYKYHLDFGKNILPKIELDEIVEENFVKNGDLFIADASEDYDDIGKSAEATNLTNRKVLSGLHTFLLRDIKNKFANGYKGFIFYNQNVSKNVKKIATGISVLGISKSNLGNIQIPLPPLNEQEKIAKILTTWDKSIDLQVKLIKEKETYKLGLMQNLLTCKMRFKEFNNEWKNSKLSNISKIKKGKQLNKLDMDEDGNFPVINGGMEASGYTNAYNTDKNTITISEGGNSCGFVNYIKTKFWSGGHCYTIEDIKEDKYFTYQFLKIKQKNIMNLRVGSGLPNIQKGDIENFKIKLPTLKEQQKISNFLSLTDKEIELQKNKLNELKNQKKSLMQNLLSGKVRVKV